jgi:hypothetical protein
MDSSESVDLEAASASSSSVDQETEIKIEDYYKQDTKTLDMSNLPLMDSVLKDMTEDIEKFITLVGAEQLLLENNKLETIPYELITFALTNKTLKYVSFKNNKFKIQNGSSEPEYLSKIVKKIKTSTSTKDGETRTRSNTIGGIISTLWDGISPEIEKAIEKSNKSQDKTLLFKKIIIIDKRIPPITIINQDELPKTTTDKCKEAFYKILYIGGGITITLIPTLITYFTGTGTCDITELNTMMADCNLSSYNYTL